MDHPRICCANSGDDGWSVSIAKPSWPELRSNSRAIQIDTGLRRGDGSGCIICFHKRHPDEGRHPVFHRGGAGINFRRKIMKSIKKVIKSLVCQMSAALALVCWPSFEYLSAHEIYCRHQDALIVLPKCGDFFTTWLVTFYSPYQISLGILFPPAFLVSLFTFVTSSLGFGIWIKKVMCFFSLEKQ